MRVKSVVWRSVFAELPAMIRGSASVELSIFAAGVGWRSALGPF